MSNKECSSCNTSNPASASFCRKCGHRFPEHTKPGKSQMCHIENFSIKRQTNGKFIVAWNAVNADKVTINGRDVTGKDKFIATVKGSETIILRAENETSFDVKEANVVYDSQTIYKDKIVEKKVTSKTNVFAIVFLLLFFLLSALLIHYAYQLENRNYSGDRYLSNIFGYKPYLLVNGSNEGRKVNVPAQEASLMYDVKTNASEYEVLDLPNWCTLEKSGSHFIIKATKNRQSVRTANIRVKTRNDEVIMRLEQEVYKPQRLLVNDKKIVDSNLSASSGQITYQVNTDADSYEVTSLSSWFKVIAQGSESFTISYEDNPKRTERTDWFKVKAEGMEVKINLTQAAQKSTAQIETITVEHDVYEDDVKGMKIHLKFSVQNMKGIKGRCVAYMYYEDGTPLKDTNGSYRTTDGQCSFGKDFTPTYDSLTFNDFVIFVPLKELEADKGEHNMKFSCTIWDKSSDSSTSIARSDYYSFTLTKK
ncbi:BACON domain-containing protein [Parabacteroides pacaensis]|uniref:BACON domain-containing protein n=1 Tax=Parabacteroides pacaensis TaxID=2086575 RepID=UPI000D0FE893|nr:BACON domain-containing carbohydrate-binding protein [Parabacteroides pacaensis]